MKSLAETYKKIWTKQFSAWAFEGALLLIIALIANFFAIRYATESVSAPVTDIIISNIRVYDVDWIIVYGAMGLIFFASIVTLSQPKRIPFVLKSVSLFILIRSVSISLTHIGPFSPQDVIDPTRILNALGITSSADLFFSGHTGMPFLLALIYWDDKILRYVFLAVSLIFGVSVLLAHVHYSIDVFAAIFITYTIFHISKYLFYKDWRLSLS